MVQYDIRYDIYDMIWYDIWCDLSHTQPPQMLVLICPCRPWIAKQCQEAIRKAFAGPILTLKERMWFARSPKTSGTSWLVDDKVYSKNCKNEEKPTESLRPDMARLKTAGYWSGVPDWPGVNMQENLM